MIVGVAFGLFAGFVAGLNASMMRDDIDSHRHASNGVRRALVITLSIAISEAVARHFLIEYPRLVALLNATRLITWGIALGLGGLFVLKHFAALLVIRAKGVGPLKYISFLNHATERILLLKVGTGYTFVHRMLMEHFASLQGPGRGATPVADSPAPAPR